jgi:hypothetical protein
MNLGGQTEGPFSNIFDYSTDGTTRPLNSTEPTITKGMNPTISGSLVEETTVITDAQWMNCKQKSKNSGTKIETYDIFLSGSRNRFTVLTDVGPIIVHNCGYGLGWRKFQGLQRVGMLGAAPNIFGPEMAAALGVTADSFMVRNGAKAMECLPPGWEKRVHEHMLHCACAKAVVDLYRQNNPNIVRLWDTASQALSFCCTDSEYNFSIFRAAKEKIYLPNGMYLHYPELSGTRGEYSKAGKNHREKVYGGLVVENLTQAVARIIMTDAMLKINKRYRVVLTVHDEVVCCAPEAEAEECYNYMRECLTAPPSYMPEIPLSCDGGFARNYSK